jgi:hypothetical protein
LGLSGGVSVALRLKKFGDPRVKRKTATTKDTNVP